MTAATIQKRGSGRPEREKPYMSQIYAKVASTIWTGKTGKELRAAGPHAQLVAFYLMTCNSANSSGLYYLPQVLIASETGLSQKAAEKALEEVLRTGFASREAPSEFVFVVEMAAYQMGHFLKASDKRHKWLVRHLDTFRNSLLLDHFYARYAVCFNLPPKPQGKPLQSLEPLRSQEQNTKDKKQELEQKQKDLPPSASGDLPSPLPPLPPVLDTPQFRERLTEWLAYKGPKAYKPQGLAAMVSRAANLAGQHGVSAVCTAMQRAMANGWKGWDQPTSFNGQGTRAADPRGNIALVNSMLAELENDGQP